MTPVDISTDDPWSWTVNDLVAELCHSPALFKAAGCRVADIPDAATLEEQLRGQEVAGPTFLTALDSSTLRSELGIQSLGQRLALVAIIDLLRGRSTAYKQYAATAGVKSLSLEHQNTPSSTLSSHVNPAVSATSDVNVQTGRKRQKLTHVSTRPSSFDRQHPQYGLDASDVTPRGEPIVDGNGDWDYLLRWEKTDQQVVDLEALTTDELIEDEDSNDIGESPEDDPQDGSDETPEVEAVPGRSKLTTDQIVDIINERIEHYTNSWTPNKGIIKSEETEYDPVQLWEKAEADGEREALIKKHETEHAYFEQRLDKLCKEIVDYAGNNVDIVRRQCGSLEVTIDSMLLSEWLLDIYKLPPIEDNDDEEEQLHTQSLSVERENAQPPTPPAVPPRLIAQQPLEIIDLGSPSESSQEQPEDMIVDRSPPPEAHVMERTSSLQDRFHTPDSLIANTVEDIAESPFEPPPLPPQVHAPRARPQQQHGDAPEKASIASARRWTWTELVEHQDRKRIVTKALQEMKSDDRETIRARLRTVGEADMIREIPACIRMLARNETKMQGVLARDMPKIITFTRLFLCWWLCDNYFRVEPSKWHLEELERCLNEGSPDPSTFCDYLNIIMTTTFSLQALRHAEQPSQSEVINISSDDDEPAPKLATQRKSQTQRPPIIILD